MAKPPPEPKLAKWTERASKFVIMNHPVKIAMVGKYTGLLDSYLSILKAIVTDIHVLSNGFGSSEFRTVPLN